MNNKTYYIVGGIVLLAVAGAVVQNFIPPAFSIESVDWTARNGYFQFGKSRETFSLGGSKGIGARNGYNIVQTTEGETAVFTMRKSGKEKILARVKFDTRGGEIIYYK